jgi:hypothetical protein
LVRISGKIRHIEQKVNTLDDAEAADVPAERLKTSWIAWIMSLIYKPAEYTDEQRAQQRERRHENMIERHQMEKQLYKQKLDFMQEGAVLRQIRQQSDAAILVIQIEINQIRDTIAAREREEKHYRDRMDQDRWAKLRREQQENAKKKRPRGCQHIPETTHGEAHLPSQSTSRGTSHISSSARGVCYTTTGSGARKPTSTELVSTSRLYSARVLFIIFLLLRSQRLVARDTGSFSVPYLL